MRSYAPLFWEISKDCDDSLNESDGIIKNFVALEEKENEETKGDNLGLKQALKDKENATCLIIINTIPVTLAECFLANSSFSNGVSAMVIVIEES
jgi:hypothetical protein